MFAGMALPGEGTTAVILALTMFLMAWVNGPPPQMGDVAVLESRHAAMIFDARSVIWRTEACDCVADPSAGGFDFYQVMMSPRGHRERSKSAGISLPEVNPAVGRGAS